MQSRHWKGHLFTDLLFGVLTCQIEVFSLGQPLIEQASPDQEDKLFANVRVALPIGLALEVLGGAAYCACAESRHIDDWEPINRVFKLILRWEELHVPQIF